MKKFEAKLGEKPSFPPVFLPLSFYFFFILCHRNPVVVVAATT
jgi:hypothetical protein